MLVLALETSCDETAAAVVERLRRTWADPVDIVHSQFDDHAAFMETGTKYRARHAELIASSKRRSQSPATRSREWTP